MNAMPMMQMPQMPAMPQMMPQMMMGGMPAMMPQMMPMMMGGMPAMMCRMTCELTPDGMRIMMKPMDASMMPMMKERCDAMNTMTAMGAPCMMMCGGMPMMMGTMMMNHANAK